MRPGTFNWPVQYAGDTARPWQFTIKEGEDTVDITDCQIKMQVRGCDGKPPILDLSTDDGLSIAITDAPNGMFRVGHFQNPSLPGAYSYDLQVSFPDGRVQTFLRGHYIIEGEVTK